MEARNFMYLTFGLITAWLILMLYVVLMLAREKRIQRELDGLKRMVDDREKS